MGGKKGGENNRSLARRYPLAIVATSSFSEMLASRIGSATHDDVPHNGSKPGT